MTIGAGATRTKCMDINMQHDDILFLIVACFQAAKLAVPALIIGYIAYKLEE